MGFSRTKDRAFAVYDRGAGWLARQPRPVRAVVYRLMGSILWGAYLLPGNTVRPTFAGLARQAGCGAPGTLFGTFVRNLMLGVDRAERVRHGFTAEIDGLLDIPDRARLDAILATGGVLLALPHAHASVPMARGLAQHYPMLAIVRLPRNPARAAAQRAMYEQVGCPIIDARNEPPVAVTRLILRALKDGKIVMGVVDRISRAPEGPVDAAADLVRVVAFGEAVGAAAWPARLARSAGVPVLPAMVGQGPDRISLLLHQAVPPRDDLVDMTQEWVDGLAELLRATPSDWTFALDKHWSRVLRSAPRNRSLPGGHGPDGPETVSAS
ncbi:hypothetical protein ACRDNQ_13370 [Palleronia sp. KMU-117]|uniref:hypothetical protein n=1 Tax=Palleronia sp. KMU-117 TaxID=3434108 RepID=UPI003D7243D8